MNVSARPILERMVGARQLSATRKETLLRDLERFPTPWLEFLDSYGVQVGVLNDGETLVDNPVIERQARSDLPAWENKVHTTIASALAQVEAPQDEMQAHMQRDQLVDNLHQWLTQHHSPYRVASHGQAVDLDQLARQRQLPPSVQKQWKEDLVKLNQPWSLFQDGRLHTTHGLFLLPPVATAYGPLAEEDFQSALATTGESVGQSLGLNRGADRLVLLHSRYLDPVAPEIGEYRVAVHEMGHALDYALEGLPEKTGFGPLHKQRIQEWYRRDKERGAFTSDRADDNPREYFAEAVEAFLTDPAAGPDFRPGNHRQRLHQLNPELESYLEQLFATRPGADWVSQPPAPVGVPPGFPDPDHDPILLP